MMIIPHSGKSTFSLSISTLALKIMGGLLAIVVAGTAIFTSHFYMTYNELKNDAEELSLVAEDYDVLQKQLKVIVEKTKCLEEKMQDIQQLDTDLRDLLEDDPALKDSIKKEDNQPGVIRPMLSSRSGIDREQAIRQLHLMELELPKQEKSLEELKDAVIQRTDRLSHTPSIYPVSGKITSHFGYRTSPFSKRQELHDGLDIAAPYGTTIVATADGMVTFVGYRSGYGNTVTIKHGYGFETSYCHNSSTLVKVGQQVSKGQAVAKVGSTGRSTGPHVHYMVKLNGELKNPADFLK